MPLNSTSLGWAPACDAMVGVVAVVAKVAVVAAAVVTIRVAEAAESIPVKVILSETVTHDDNVFRTSSAPIADTIYSTSIRVALDKEISRQRFQGAVTYADNRYHSLDRLNNVSSNYLLGWQATLPGSVTTDASWSRSESLVNYADFRNTSAKDIVTAESTRFRLGYLPHPDWPTYIQQSYGSISNSAAALTFNDLKTNSTEAGLQYNSAIGNQASLLVRKTDGHYPNLSSAVGADFRQEDFQAAIQYKPGLVSAFNFQFGRTRREQANQPTRDFVGTTGRVSFDWAATSKTTLNANLGREVAPITAVTTQDLNAANFALVRSYGFGVSWAATPMVSADARVNHFARDIRGGRADSTTASTLSLRYTPIRALQVSLQLKHEVRQSDSALVLAYKSNVGVLSVTFSF